MYAIEIQAIIEPLLFSDICGINEASKLGGDGNNGRGKIILVMER